MIPVDESVIPVLGTSSEKNKAVNDCLVFHGTFDTKGVQAMESIDNSILLKQMQELSRKLESQKPRYDGEDILVNDAIEKWLDTKRVLYLRENTYEVYESKYYGYLKPFFMG